MSIFSGLPVFKLAQKGSAASNIRLQILRLRAQSRLASARGDLGTAMALQAQLHDLQMKLGSSSRSLPGGGWVGGGPYNGNSPFFTLYDDRSMNYGESSL